MCKQNTAPFHIGQKVVCIDAPGKLVLGKTYTVLDLMVCEKCGIWYVAHSTSSERNDRDMFPCCGSRIKTHTYRWAMAKRFAPIQPRHNEVEICSDLKQLKEVKETSDVIPETIEINN